MTLVSGKHRWKFEKLVCSTYHMLFPLPGNFKLILAFLSCFHSHCTRCYGTKRTKIQAVISWWKELAILEIHLPTSFSFFPDIQSCCTVQVDLELSILLFQPLTCWLGPPPPPPHFIMHIETQGFLEIQILTLPFSALIITINVKFNTSWNSMFCFSSFSLNHHFDSRVKLVDTKTHDICKIPNI